MEKVKKASATATCSHNIKELGYMQWFAWADKLTISGIKQHRCPVCKLWLFPEEFKTKRKPTTNDKR